MKFTRSAILRASEIKENPAGYLAALEDFREADGGYEIPLEAFHGIREAFPQAAPDPTALLVNVVTALGKWARAGFPVVSESVYRARIETCRSCAYWREGSRLGLGRCLQCGCSRLKHWLQTESCPIEKWTKAN